MGRGLIFEFYGHPLLFRGGGCKKNVDGKMGSYIPPIFVDIIKVCSLSPCLMLIFLNN